HDTPPDDPSGSSADDDQDQDASGDDSSSSAGDDSSSDTSDGPPDDQSTDPPCDRAPQRLVDSRTENQENGVHLIQTYVSYGNDCGADITTTKDTWISPLPPDNDDPTPPSVSISDAVRVDGGSDLQFHITLSAATDHDVTVGYHTSDGSISGEATIAAG